MKTPPKNFQIRLEKFQCMLGEAKTMEEKEYLAYFAAWDLVNDLNYEISQGRLQNKEEILNWLDKQIN